MSIPKPHPLCDMFPRPSDEQKADLKDHIRRVGLLKPLTCWKDEHDKEWLIDGLTRNTVIDELLEEGITEAANGQPIGKAVEWIQGTKGDIFEYVIGMNFSRREMSKSQRAALAVMFSDLEVKYKGKGNGDYATKIAEASGVNRQYIFDCKKIREHSVDLLRDVVSGSLTVKEALAKAKGTDQATTEKPTEAPEAVVVLDGLKRPVEEEFHEIFAARSEYAKAIKLIKEANAILEALKEQAGGRTIPTELGQDLSNLAKTIKEVQPHIIDPACSGTGKDPNKPKSRCPNCKGNKYIDKVQFGLLSEELAALVSVGGEHEAE